MDAPFKPGDFVTWRACDETWRAENIAPYTASLGEPPYTVLECKHESSELVGPFWTVIVVGSMGSRDAFCPDWFVLAPREED